MYNFRVLFKKTIQKYHTLQILPMYFCQIFVSNIWSCKHNWSLSSVNSMSCLPLWGIISFVPRLLFSSYVLCLNSDCLGKDYNVVSSVALGKDRNRENNSVTSLIYYYSSVDFAKDKNEELIYVTSSIYHHLSEFIWRILLVHIQQIIVNFTKVVGMLFNLTSF